MKNLTLSLLVVSLFVSVSMTFPGGNAGELDFRLKQYKDRDTVTADYVVNHMNLTVLYVGDDRQLGGDEYKVTGFMMVIVPKVGEAEAAYGISDLLPEMIKPRLRSGTKIIFQDIEYTRHDGTKGLIEKSMFVIK